MSVVRCLLEKAKAGRLSDKKAREFVDQIKKATTERGPREAARSVLDAVRHRAALRKRQQFLQINRQTAIQQALEAVGPDKVEKRAMAFLHFDETGEFGGNNVYIQAETVTNQTFAEMAEFFDRFRSRFAGLQRAGKDKASMRNVVRATFGQKTADESANQVGEVISRALDNLRQRANLAGADIDNFQDFGLPQTHDRAALARVSEREWIDYIMPRLNRKRMLNFDTRQPMTDEELRNFLSASYTNIVTDGLADVRPGQAFKVKRSIANRLSASRRLHFLGPDEWLEYQGTFGAPDIFTHITNHVRGMATDIAAMEVLGPNPDATVDFMKQVVGSVKGRAAVRETGREAVGRIEGLLGFDARFERLYAVVTKSYLTPENEFWANLLGGVRNVLTSTFLGSSFLSAITDVGFSSVTAAYNGLSSTRLIRRQLKTFSTASASDRRAALRAGLTVDSWVSSAGPLQRFVGESIGPEWTERFADFVLRASFLSPWTDAGRIAFGNELLFNFTDQVGRRFSKLDDLSKRTLQRHGITAADWEVIRKTPLAEDPDTGLRMLRPQDIISADLLGESERRRTLSLASRFHGMVLTESKFAIPETTGKARALLTGGAAPGSVVGEVARNTALFKSFPATVVMTHLMGRGFFNTELGNTGKFKYLAHMIVATTALGGLAIQLKDISRGRDPRNMRSAEFLGAALLQGGGIGILGDFLFADVNRFGGGLATTIAGPVVGLGQDLLRLTIGNILELGSEGEAKSFGPELIRFLRAMTPGQNLWYTRLAMERLVWDEMLKATDPQYSQRFRRIRRKARKEFGADFFSRPGQGVIPQRAPDLSTALRSDR